MGVDAPELEGFERSSFTAMGSEYPVYRAGTGPAVIVVHEVPGITPLVAGFGREVADAGLTAVLPSLFGTPGKPMTAGYAAKVVAQCCISREFATLAMGRTSPITMWLRKLAAAEHERCGGPGVGAVGMCMTGGFALAMMVDESLAAPVLAQPSTPFAVSPKRSRDLGLSGADLRAVRDRAAAGCEVLGLRYRDDRAVGSRFERLSEELGDAFIKVEFPGSKHSTLTVHRQQEAVDRVLAFLHEKPDG